MQRRSVYYWKLMNEYQLERVITAIIGSKMDVYITSKTLNITPKGETFTFVYEVKLGKPEKIEVWDYIYLDGDDYGSDWNRQAAYSMIMRAFFKDQWDEDLQKLQENVEIPERAVYDKGPWFVTDTYNVASEDFTHDVILEISGDFEGDWQKEEYAECLCEVLCNNILLKKD